MVQASAKLAGIAVSAPTPLPPTAGQQAAANAANSGASNSNKSGTAGMSSSTATTSSVKPPSKPQPASAASTSVAPPQPPKKELTFDVPLGSGGLGLVLTVVNAGTAESSVHVKEFGASSPCAAAGIKVGDRVMTVNNQAVSDIDAVRGILKSAKGSVKIQVLR